MSDDIVTRLRDKFQGQLPICAEAANEIERLRAEIDGLRIRVFTLLKKLEENNG
jgi:hypothetical protein